MDLSLTDELYLQELDRAFAGYCPTEPGAVARQVKALRRRIQHLEAALEVALALTIALLIILATLTRNIVVSPP